MEKIFDIILQNRRILLKILKQTPRRQLVLIPQGFNNNIWWNIAHVLVTHQTLLYALSGLPAGIDESLIQKYRKGTFPLEVPSGEEVAKLASLLLETVERSRQDYAEGLFKGFKEYTTSVGITLRSVEDAITFDCFHEGLHLGVIMSLRKVV